MTERWKLKERELELKNFEARQSTLKEMEILKLREKEIEKQVEINLKSAENDRMISKQIRSELENKEKQIIDLKLNLQKEKELEVKNIRLEIEQQYQQHKQSLEKQQE